MSERSTAAPRTTYQAPVVEEIGQIHEVGERKAWGSAAELASAGEARDTHTA